MRIVREQCLAGFASLRPNDPRVAAVKFCKAWKQRIAVQRGKEMAIDGNVRNCSRGLRPPAMLQGFGSSALINPPSNGGKRTPLCAPTNLSVNPRALAQVHESEGRPAREPA